MKKETTLCPIPWTHSAIRNNGHFRVCCHANISEGQGNIRNAEGKNSSVINTSIQDTRNSKLLKDIRKKMLNSQWHDSCQRCKSEEESGLRSRRIYEWDRVNNHLRPESLINNTSRDGSINEANFDLFSLDLRFGNHCNLKCRMCGPSDSNKWYSDYKKIFQTSLFSDGTQQVDFEKKSTIEGYNWHQKEGFWRELELGAKNIKYIYMVGGEPLLIEEHVDFLNSLIKANKADSIEIEYNTNLTIINQNLLETWKKFKKVKIGVSIDGIGNVNDYIRYPSKFSRVISNLEYLDNLNNENFEIWISPTIQIYNIFDIKNITTWILKSNFRFVKKRKGAPLFTFHLLHHPSYLNIKILPIEIKLKAIVHIQETIDILLDPIQTKHYSNSSISKLISNLEGIIKSLRSQEDLTEFKKFITYSENLDRVRKQKLSSFIPNLQEIFNSYILANR